MGAKHTKCLVAVIGLVVMSSQAFGQVDWPLDETPADDNVIEIDAGNYKTPTRQIKLAEYPTFTDDKDLIGLKTAIDRQLKRFEKKKLVGTILMGGKSYKLTKVKASLEAFRLLIDQFESCAAREAKDRCYGDFNQAIRTKFDVFAPNLTKNDPRFGKENFAFFTGYHTHHIEGKLAAEGEFKHAIYANPKNANLNNKTRVQIDFEGALKGRGLDFVYTNSLFDIYLMHVAGSGKVTLKQPDGSTKDFYLHWDGTNRQRWEFISLYMAKMGYITNGSIASQRKFLREHPEKQKEIFNRCPSYVYLRPSAEPPRGSDMVAVTDGRSIAQDLAHYAFKGLIAYVQTERPQETGIYDLEQEDRTQIPFQGFSRFFLDQDTGGAINGKARADIYFGADDYAFFSAMHMEQTGKIHFLMLK